MTTQQQRTTAQQAGESSGFVISAIVFVVVFLVLEAILWLTATRNLGNPANRVAYLVISIAFASLVAFNVFVARASATYTKAEVDAKVADAVAAHHVAQH